MFYEIDDVINLIKQMICEILKTYMDWKIHYNRYMARKTQQFTNNENNNSIDVIISEVYSEPSQTSKTKSFAKIINCFQL